MIYTIKNSKLCVKISDFGAEIQSIIYNNIERVWQNENGKWSRHSPILFPVCGNKMVKIGSKIYDMPFHGFARDAIFMVEEYSKDSIIFSLKYSTDSLLKYPYKFLLLIKYTIKDNAIYIENRIKNLDDKKIYFALGRHDSFILKNPLDNYKICFNENEIFKFQQTNEYGKLIDKYDYFGEGKELTLNPNYLSNNRSIILGDIKSNNITLKTIDGMLVTELFLDKTNNLLIWRPDETNMICLELWSSLPDYIFNDLDIDKNSDYIEININEESIINYRINYYDNN